MSTVVKISCLAEVEEAGGIDGKNVETEWIFSDGFEAELMGCWDLIILMICFGLNTQNIDVFLLYKGLEDSLFPGFFMRRNRLELGLVDVFETGPIHFLKPIILRRKLQAIEEMILLSSRDQLAGDKPIEGFYICWIFLQAFLIQLYGHQFILLCVVALCLDE